MKQDVIIVPAERAVPSFARQERWLLAGLLCAAFGAFILTFVALRPFDVSRVSRSGVAAAAARAPAFDIDAELSRLMLSDPVDLSANADLPPGDVFAEAKGPPLNLLAQVEKPAPVALAAAEAAPVPSGPVLTEEEKMIVEANAERREVRLALDRLFERSESGNTSVAAAVIVQPLLRRAEQAAGQLDVYGDSLLLSEGTAMKQVAFAGFHASRAAALMDMARAEAILG